ncbi:hypothetical protein CAL26_08910 [Bordetella genomosp. 9]|uniref:Uncharacterized protein n=2 Tax=Bordetella genomosp. 9 TaxID=1416803 RepID=A0A261RFU6_9BORD|nr:hypothetical protein CAL26_08910 [Bordetella genomosp. 9]
MARSDWDIALSSGETRVVYLPRRALILGVKGHVTVVERVNGIGDAGFSLCIPVRGGESHTLTYGGQVLVRATQVSNLHIVPPQPYFAAWGARCARMFKGLQQTASAVSRHLHGV